MDVLLRFFILLFISFIHKTTNNKNKHNKYHNNDKTY